ncbi:MAG: HAMP domain-containing sensor histidine kinase [Candidatus Binatia bacterium]
MKRRPVVDLQRSYEEQRVLREFLSNLLLLGLDELLQKFTEQAAYLFHAEIAWVRLLDSEGKMLGRAAAGDETVLRILPIKGVGQVVGRGMWMLENRKPLAVRDMAHDSDRPYHGTVKAADLHGFLGAPLFSKVGKPLGVIFVMTRSPRKFSRREMDLIEQFANGAAIAIDNAKLFEEVQNKSREAVEAYEAKSEFLNTLAHELRTPLNVIIGSLQLMLDGFYGKVTEKQKPGLEMLERNAYDLRNLINEVLDLARIEAGRVPVIIEEFAPKEVIGELESSYMDLYGEKGLELKIKMENSVPRLRSDKSKIKEILQNLLANAAKYTEKGVVELKVHCLKDKQGDSERTRVAFSVRDTGIGIKSEELAHLFEPFYMAEGLDRKRYPGTGLGLSIVKRLVEILDGEIKVESEWGIGSTFTVIFPLVRSSQQ